MPAFQLLLGPQRFDAAAYVRDQVEDPFPGMYLSDKALQSYAEVANEDFSRHIPRDLIVGNPATATSPLVTVQFQQRYVCDPAHGFAESPVYISDCLYSATGGMLNAANEASYLFLMPFSPIGRFLTDPYILDNPSMRIVREEYLNELAHYARGTFGVVVDPATGLLAIDLWPIPLQAGLAIYVRYQSAHVIVKTGTSWTIPTIPAAQARNWSKLLLLEVLEQESGRMERNRSVKAGLIAEQTDAKTHEARLNRIRDEVYGALGATSGVAISTH